MRRSYPEDDPEFPGPKSKTPTNAEDIVKADKVKANDPAMHPLLPEHDEQKNLAALDQRVEKFKRLCDAQVADVLADIQTLVAKFAAPASVLAAQREQLTTSVQAREQLLLSPFYRFYCYSKDDKFEDIVHLDRFLESDLYAMLKALLYDGNAPRQFDYSKEKPGMQATVEHMREALKEVEALCQDALFYRAYPPQKGSYQPPTPK